jgi:HAMP domain-containing protein
MKTLVFVIGALLMLAPAIVAGAMFTDAMQRRAETANGARLRVLGEIAADQLERRMHHLWQDVEGMARFATMSDPEEIRGHLTFLSQVDPRYAWIGVADVEGRVVAASQSALEGESVAEHLWFRRGLNGPAAAVPDAAGPFSKLLSAAQGSHRLMNFSAPIRSVQGAVIGVLGAYLDWSWVKESLQPFRGPGIDILLVSRGREVLFGPEELQGLRLSEGSAVAAEQGATISLRERWQDGRDYMTAVVPLIRDDMPRFGWSVIVRADTNTMLDPTRSIADAFWASLAAGLMAALILLYLFAAWIATPLRRLVGTAEMLANGRPDRPPHDETRYQEAARLSAALVRLQTFSVRPYQPAPTKAGKTSLPAP